MATLDYSDRPVRTASRKHSGLGATSILLAAFTALVANAARLAAIDAQRTAIYYRWIEFTMMYWVAFGGAATGIILALIGQFQKGRRRELVVIGLLVNIALLVCIVVWGKLT